MQTKIKSMSDLTKDLADTYSELRNGKINIDAAKEVANLAGKLIKSVCAQLMYNEFMQDKAEIPFFKLEQPIKIENKKELLNHQEA